MWARATHGPGGITEGGFTVDRRNLAVGMTARLARRTLGAALVAAVLALGGSAPGLGASGTLFGITRSSGDVVLVSIDPSSGAQTTVGTLPGVDGVYSAAALDSTGHRYFQTIADVDGFIHVDVVSTVSGALLSSPTVPRAYDSLGYEPPTRRSSDLTRSSGDVVLVSIDPSSGAQTTVGTLPGVDGVYSAAALDSTGHRYLQTI